MGCVVNPMRDSVGLYALSLGLGTLLSLALAAYGWRRRRLVPGGAAFAVFNLGVAVWTSVYILEAGATGAAAVFWANMAYLGIGLVPAGWLVFAIQYSGRDWPVTRRVVGFLCIEPVATLLLAWTNPWHRLFRLSVEVTPTWQPGPAFWVHVAYSYVLVLAGTVLVARRAIERPRPGHSAVLLVGAFAPWMANAVYLGGLSPFGNLDLTPFGFGLTSLAVAWGLFYELEQRLVAAERRFRALLDHAIDAIEVIDPETGRFLDVNERACAARGYTRDEFLELSISEIDQRVAERSWEKTRDEVRRLGTYVFESEHRRKDGSVFPVEVNATHISLEREYVLAIVRDVTETKRLEERLRQSQKMEAVGRLAGGVAHDFNNILGIVIGYAEAVSRLMGHDDPLRSKVEEILKAAGRAASLTRQLLAFSRQQVLQPRILDLNVVVSEIDDMLRRLIGEDVELVTTLAPGLGSVEADLGQIQQVIMNLAVNARDAMPQGGQLRIETSNVEEPAGRIPVPTPGPCVMLVVTDTGLGMDADTQARIFEPFFTTKGLGRGTGLGLSTVYGIVQQSGGSIYIESEVGVGTSFRIYLPRVVAAPLPGASRKSASTVGGSETLLLVEDEAGLRDLLQDLLEGAGYCVLVARDGRDAVQVAAAHSEAIHLMVTDLIMPGATGREAAEEIHASRPGMLVLYMSGYADDAILRRGVPDTAAFLAKPFAAASLLRTVRELLDSRSASNP
jgi:PAS domain S-box-containing protein